MNKKMLLAINSLTERDSDLATVIDRFGYPPTWKREPGFSTLIRIILEQQVSLASAQATFNRLCTLISPVTPESFLNLKDMQLKGIGISRQKISYGRELSQAIINGQLDLNGLEKLDDLTIRNRLKKIKGIGDWTVDMYLMMALQRQDVFPSRDLAVAIAVQEIKHLPTRPQPTELEAIALVWRPYRAIATKILWHYYLNNKRKINSVKNIN